MFATSEALGYDPAVQRRVDPHANSQLCYVYQVGTRFFKTTRCISARRSHRISGPATRVWEVVQVPSFDDLDPIGDARPMVLKEAWRDHGARTEREIQDAIFADLESFADGSKAEKEPVQLSGIEPETKARLLNALANKTYKNYFLHIEDVRKGLESKPLSTSAVPFADDGPDDQCEPVTTSVRRDCKQKHQSRVVYAEVCEALHELSSISSVLEAMMDGVDGELVRSSNCKTRLI
jgi:hypothetical protein